jgi:hypothetical protein
MKRLRPSLVFSLLVLSLCAFAVEANAIAASIEPPSDIKTTSPLPSRPSACNPSPIQLSWFYKPPKNTSLDNVADHFDYYILTKNDEQELSRLHRLGEGPVLQYLHWDSINDPCFQAKKPKGTPCSCGKRPLNNQAAWNPEDICWIRDNHPEWFLRDSEGNLLYYNHDLMMDPGSEGWLDYFLARMEKSQRDGWDGVFFDNLGTRFTVHWANPDVKLKKYPTLDSYRAAAMGFLKEVNQRYFDPEDKPLFANISVRWGDNPTYFSYLSYFDGVMDEYWAVSRTGYYSVKSWEDRLLRAEGTLKQGKSMILVAQGTEQDYSRQRFTLASYLLIASDKAYFRYTRNDAYSQSWTYENYGLPLGKPLGDYTRNGNTWSRRFTNGEVKVNPETRTSSIKVYRSNLGCNW